MEELILRIIGKYKTPQRNKANLKKKNETGTLISPNFQPYYKGTVVKICDTGSKIKIHIYEIR